MRPTSGVIKGGSQDEDEKWMGGREQHGTRWGECFAMIRTCRSDAYPNLANLCAPCGRCGDAQWAHGRWFATLTQKYIRRGTHRSTRQLEQAIRHYIKVNNNDPKPFVWSKTADDILASVERFCLRTSNSRH